MRKIAVAWICLLLGACNKQPNPQTTAAALAASNANVAPAPAPPTFDIPAGASIRVRIDQTLDSRRNRRGDRFSATLDGPILIGGQEAIPNGTRFEGHVTDARPSGRFKGRAEIGLTLDSFTIDGEQYPIDTAADRRAGGGHKKRNFAFIGGGAAAGAGIGALAGGGAGGGRGSGDWAHDSAVYRKEKCCDSRGDDSLFPPDAAGDGDRIRSLTSRLSSVGFDAWNVSWHHQSNFKPN
jgi:hypothetical protein